MKIHQLKINNFKGFSEKTFRLDPHITVFIGDNASGKTAVLDALSVALGSFFIEMGGISARSIRPDEVRTIIQQDLIPVPQLPVSIVADGEVAGQTLRWERSITHKNTTIKGASELSRIGRKMLEESRKPRTTLERDVVFPVIAYHGTGRLWTAHEKIDFKKQKEGAMMAYINCLSAKSSPKEFLSWFKTQEDSVLKFGRPLETAHLEAMKNTIMSMLPDNRWRDIRFDRKVEDLVGIFRNNEGADNPLSFSQLSDGYRVIISLAADIGYRCIQLNPHLGERAVTDTPGVVLIDELDLHLHPNWQRHVVSDLKRTFPKIQFVATTHSPSIVQSLDSHELVSLDTLIDTAPNALSIEQVGTFLMGVESNFSEDNFSEEKNSKHYFEALQNGEVLPDVSKISNPAIRAYLELTKMAHGK